LRRSKKLAPLALIRGVHIEATPNPSARKAVPGCDVLPPGTETTLAYHADDVSPNTTGSLDGPTLVPPTLVSNIFALGHVESVLLGPDFVTVAVTDPPGALLWHDATFEESVRRAVSDFFGGSAPVGRVTYGDVAAFKAFSAQRRSMCEEDETERTPAERKILQLLEEHVRPHVQADGGDVAFAGFDPSTGTVRLRLVGACASCPSSTTTVRFMIRNLLCHYVDEVRDVVEVEDASKEPSEGGSGSGWTG
jgi:Fe-S cluster biogenesis protein NfuA